MHPEDVKPVRVVQSGKRDVFVCTSSGQVTIYKRYHLPSRWTGSWEPTPISSLPPWLIIQASPKPRFPVSDIAVSFSGKFAILSGVKDGMPALGLLMLTPPPGRFSQSGEAGGSLEGSFYPWVAPKVGRGTPEILKIQWFKGSDIHVCVLTSNNHLLVYKVREGPIMEADQVYALWVGSGQPSCGYIGNERRVIDFSFGPCTLWGVYSLFFLCSDGALFLLCPVVPRGSCVPVTIQQQMKESIQNAGIVNGQEFIDALESSEDRESVETTKQHEAMATHFTGINLEMTSIISSENGIPDHGYCPSLQGPLNANCESVWSDEDNDTEASSLCIAADDSGIGIIVVVASSGIVYFHTLLDDVLPEWSSAQPRRGRYACPSSAKDDILAHLYSAVVPEDECLEVYEIPCACGEFACWGNNNTPFHIRIPSLENLYGDPPENMKSLDEDLFVKPITSLAHTSPGDMMGILWTTDEAVFVYNKKDRIEILPFNAIPKWDSAFSEREDVEAGRDHVSKQSLSKDPAAQSVGHTGTTAEVEPVSGGSPPQGSSLELIQELRTLFDEQLATARRCHQQVDIYGQYLEGKISTGEILVEGYDKQCVIWEDLWTVLDMWPSEGSCELIHELNVLDIEAVKTLIMGLSGACKQSRQPRQTGRNVPSKTDSDLDLTGVAQAAKENDLLVLGARELLSQVYARHVQEHHGSSK